MARNHRIQACPDCGDTGLRRKRPILGALFGGLLILVGFAFFLPTLGLSLVLSLWGVLIAVPRMVCGVCGWERRE